MGTLTKYKQGAVDCVLTHYASIAEMEQDCIDKAMQSQVNAKRNAEIQRSQGGNSWYGVENLERVKHLIREGYPEGAAKVDSLYETIAPSLPRAVDFRRRRVRSDQGDSLDIHAVNRGALDKAWETIKRRPHTGSGLVRIAVDICGNAYVRAEQLQWRGIAALALSRAMSKAGYSVEIVAGQSGANAFSGSKKHGTITCTVKPRYASIDTATLAASLCLPGFFRYLGFASIVRQADDLGLDACLGLGRAVKLETLLPVPEKIAQVIVPETVSDQLSAIEWVNGAVHMLQGSSVSKEST
jgi:hypothetical protein